MADLDTQRKRMSAIGFAGAFTGVLPLVDATDAETIDERAHLAYSYAGGAFAEPTALVWRTRRYLWRNKKRAVQVAA